MRIQDDDRNDSRKPAKGISLAPTFPCDKCGAVAWEALDRTHYRCGKCRKKVVEVDGRRV